MSVLCSFHDNRILLLNSIVCVHHVAVNGEAVNSNIFFSPGKLSSLKRVDSRIFILFIDNRNLQSCHGQIGLQRLIDFLQGICMGNQLIHGKAHFLGALEKIKGGGIIS